MEPTIQEYYELVKRYCSFIEGRVISRNHIEELTPILLKLYEKAFHLPDLEVKGVSIKEPHKRLPLKMEIPDSYWMVFDPFEKAEEVQPVCGMISDDLIDIYRELKEGQIKYEMGEVCDAVFDWKNGAGGHWGDHAVNLLKALHWLMKIP